MRKSIFTIAFCLIASQVFAFNLATGKDGGMYAKIGTYYLPKQLDNKSSTKLHKHSWIGRQW